MEVDLLQTLNLRWSHIRCLGSAGRRKNPDDTSGDIDIAILRSSLGKDKSSVLTKLEDFAIGKGYEYHRMEGLGILSIAYPIVGQDGSFVQVDLMCIENLNWVRWAMYSPDYRTDESQYKGGHRNWLIAAICNEHKKPMVIRDGVNITWDSLIFSWSDCAKWVKKTLKGERSDLLKNPKKLSETIYTRSPSVFVKFLFGDSYKPSDLLTYEDVRRALDDTRFDHNRKKILDNFVKFLKRADLPVPDDTK